MCRCMEFEKFNKKAIDFVRGNFFWRDGTSKPDILLYPKQREIFFHF